MPEAKADILASLRKEIADLQGHPSRLQGLPAATGLGPLAAAFADGVFPSGTVHEFLVTRPEEAAATYGFMTALLAPLLQAGGVLFWVSSSRQLFPPALQYFGIAPDRVMFADLRRGQDLVWAMEEIIQCGAATAVVAEMSQLSFLASRRLQLRTEQSGTTGFIICHRPRPLYTTACTTRWKICPLPGQPLDNLPGLGAPCWQVDLLKVRNGRPGSWEIKWMDGRFVAARRPAPAITVLRQKTG